jgi:hypothetical protein
MAEIFGLLAQVARAMMGGSGIEKKNQQRWDEVQSRKKAMGTKPGTGDDKLDLEQDGKQAGTTADVSAAGASRIGAEGGRNTIGGGN